MIDLYGYKRCSTCRQAHKALVAHGARVRFHDFVETPPDAATLRAWMDKSGRPVLDFVNTKGTVYRERHLRQANLTQDAWLQELSRDGKLLRRPIAITEQGDVWIGYDADAWSRLAALDSEQSTDHDSSRTCT
ncbi:MAG: Spx/MgsR family RNA polymerase-binding regulatory protein [Firmicutes bacterium]|nr:Spx/MgsR family RNA polymerase-binding regulatory protein [Bacillota bacterium]